MLCVVVPSVFLLLLLEKNDSWSKKKSSNILYDLFVVLLVRIVNGPAFYLFFIFCLTQCLYLYFLEYIFDFAPR